MPRPCTVTTLPRSRSCSSARRTVTLATPYWTASSASLGSRVSGAIRPASISASMSAATWTVTGVAESCLIRPVKRDGTWRVTENDPDSEYYAASPDANTVIAYMTTHTWP